MAFAPDPDFVPEIGDPGGICVGATKKGDLLIDRSEQQMRVIGPPGTGKTFNVFFPTLLRTWRGSTFVHDRKGDFWRLLQSTAKWRHNILFSPSLPDTARYNPMLMVPTDDRQIAGFQNLAGLLPHGDKLAGNKEPIWDENAKAYVTGQMMFINNFMPHAERNFAGLRRFHATGRQGAEMMMRQQHPNPNVREEIATAATKLWTNDNERYVGSINATIDSYLNVYADPYVARATSACDFTPADLVCGPSPVMVVLHLPPEHSSRLTPLTRMLISQTMNALQGEVQEKVGDLWKRHWMLWAIDELYRFGKVDALVDALADMRSYYMKALLGSQTDGSLEEIYGRESMIFSTRLVAFRPNNPREAERIERYVADYVAVGESESANYGLIGQHTGAGISRSEKRVPLIHRGELMRLPKDRMLVLNQDKPVLAYRPPLWTWQSLVDPQPVSWNPFVCELLPIVDGNGEPIGLPLEMAPRDPWADILHEVPPPPSEIVPVEEEDCGEDEDDGEESKTLGIGLKDKVFDWAYERRHLSPKSRTACYPEPLWMPPTVSVDERLRRELVETGKCDEDGVVIEPGAASDEASDEEFVV